MASNISYFFPGGLLHELSNEGARQQFQVFLEEMILPQMCVCAQVSHLVRTSQLHRYIHPCVERAGLVVECLSRDRESLWIKASLTGRPVTA